MSVITASTDHIGAAVLHDFLLGRLEHSANRRIVRHLLSGCRECHEVAEGFWRLHFGPDPDEGIETECVNRYLSEPCFEHVLMKVKERERHLADEREQAEVLFRELEPHPVGRQLMVVRNSPRFRTWGLCEHLLRISWAARFDDSVRTVEFAELAVAVADNLDSEVYGRALVQDLRGRAWAYLANALRIRSDYAPAEEAFATAKRMLAEGTTDPLEKARLLELEAYLLGDLNRFEEAKRLFSRMAAIYRQLGDEHFLGAALAELGRIHGYIGDLDEGIHYIRQGLALLDPSAEPHRTLAARHNLIYQLQAGGQLQEALELVRETRPLYVHLGDRLNLLRLRRLEGEIAQSLGHYTMAERAFLEARNGFIGQGMGHDAAEISLELAALYLSQNRTAETRQLAMQMLPIFQSRDLDQEVLAALIVFKQAVEAEVITVELTREVLATLERVGEPARGLDD